MVDITLGQVVHSKAGRDKGQYFIVVGIVDDNYVYIADGNLRKISNPKKKKIMHLVFHDKIVYTIQTKLKENLPVIDSEIRDNLQSMGLL